MEQKTSSFDRVLGAWDILVIAFGAMIGWGWVVSTGTWIQDGGVLGAAIGFLIGGVMIFFVGLTYAELTSAMPQCGGEHVFSHRAMGPIGSFICTWAIVLGYASVVCFEACALPTIVTYIFPDFLQGYLYTVAGFKVYASWLAVAIGMSILMTWINIRGVKAAAKLQTALTLIIGAAGILLIIVSALTGSVSTLEPQAFLPGDSVTTLKAVLAVAVTTPFYFIGFDVIPQAAEEINVPLKKIGKILILSVVCAVLFYALVIIAVGLVLTGSAILASASGTGLVTADAMAKALSSATMAEALTSCAIYSMAESYMVPRFFAKLHPKYKTPINALYLIGFLSIIAPLAGRKMLVWIVDAGNFGCCLAYCMVALSFLILRKKEPDLPRPFKVSHYKIVGTLAVLMSGLMIALYAIPNSGSTLVWQEWCMAGGWGLLGIVFAIACKNKYQERFGLLIDIISDEDAAALQSSDEEISVALDRAIDDAINKILAERRLTTA